VDFYIVNFDGTKVGAQRNRLGGFCAELAARNDIELVIIDEASAYKHANTRRHRIGRQIFNKPYLWLLTGTPTAQGHLSAYGQAKLVNNAHGESWGSFVARTTIPVSKFKRIPTQDAFQQARKLLTPAIRYDIRDVWDGPPYTTQNRDVELTAEQKLHMRALKTQLAVQMKDGTLVVPANEAAARAKFLQICMGAMYDADHKAHYIDASPRLNELKDIIESAPAKLIIFSPLTSVITLLYRALADWTREVINGEVSLKERTRIVSAFQLEDSPRIIIADPVATHFGLTLHRAQTTVWYGPIDKAEVFQQANKRAHRPGQKFPVTNVQIVSTGLEREIYRRLANNQLLQGALLEMVRKGEL
jgi:SNF2 family DNA or RNA helicase